MSSLDQATTDYVSRVSKKKNEDDLAAMRRRDSGKSSIATPQTAEAATVADSVASHVKRSGIAAARSPATGPPTAASSSSAKDRTPALSIVWPSCPVKAKITWQS